MIVFCSVACSRDGETTSATATATPAQTAVAAVGAPTPAASAEPTAVTAPDVADLIRLGHDLYAINCAPCHQVNGEGNLNRFPALNGNAFVRAQQPQPLIQTVLYGRGGVMPGFASTLSDREIAAVLSYIRNTWDNSAPVVSTTEVSQVKEATTPTPAISREEEG